MEARPVFRYSCQQCELEDQIRQAEASHLATEGRYKLCLFADSGEKEKTADSYLEGETHQANRHSATEQPHHDFCLCIMLRKKTTSPAKKDDCNSIAIHYMNPDI